jgi:hypothetical protein
MSLIGCVKTKAHPAMAARDLYQSPLFREPCAYAGRSGRPWYVQGTCVEGAHPPHCGAAWRPLTTWMERHLGAVTVALKGRDRLGELENRVLRRMDPPLNPGSVPVTPLRRRLGELRRAWRAS